MDRRDLSFRVFASSTFSDLVAERNFLQKQRCPQLHQLCCNPSGRLQPIDRIGRESNGVSTVLVPQEFSQTWRSG